jgi:hypothetical protein
MADTLTELDRLLLERWPDTVGLWQAIKDLEERLGDSLKRVADRLTPWLSDQGFSLLDVSTKDASIEFAQLEWLNKKEEPLITASIAEMFPFGYRRVKDEHPYIWLYAEALPEDQREVFHADSTQKLKTHTDGWINENCDVDWPVGRYCSQYADKDRIALASSEEALEEFVRGRLQEFMTICPTISESLKAALAIKPARGR